ncbi:Glutathione S-transferase S1 [Podila epigama]|nr:Glutathione S-transferase S1 [Podila epigama]
MAEAPKISMHANAAEKLQVLEDPNKSFVLTYWPLSSVGGTSRDILAYGKGNWKCGYVGHEQWVKKEYATPLSYLPVLTITSSTGKEVHLAEAMVIDCYLAEEFGLLGDNKYERLMIESFNSSIHFLMERCFRVFRQKETTAQQGLDNFMSQALAKFVSDHEFHLRNNGNNGHYVGNKMSLADIHLVNAIHFFKTLPFDDIIYNVFRKSEPIWKVWETVLANPEIKAWRSTDEFKSQEEASRQMYSALAIPKEEKENATKE